MPTLYRIFGIFRNITIITYTTKKYYSCCIYRRGSRIARITNTAKVVHKRALTICQFCDS